MEDLQALSPELAALGLEAEGLPVEVEDQLVHVVTGLTQVPPRRSLVRDVMALPLDSYGLSAVGPSAAGAPSGATVTQLPKHLQQDLEIRQLCDLYQRQLAELNACHSLLTVDQERLASMLAPYVNTRGELVMHRPDPDVLLFKQGLDLRLKEFEEDCNRIKRTEAALQLKIEQATADYEQTLHSIATTADARIFRRLREQQRLITLQQQEIDQVRYEKELLQEETRRLRELAGQTAPARPAEAPRPGELGQLHCASEAAVPAPPLEGTQQRVLFPSHRR